MADNRTITSITRIAVPTLHPGHAEQQQWTFIDAHLSDGSATRLVTARGIVVMTADEFVGLTVAQARTHPQKHGIDCVENDPRPP